MAINKSIQIYNLVDLRYVPAKELPRTIADNINNIFVKDAEDIRNVLEKFNTTTLSPIRTALRKKAIGKPLV